MTNGKDVATAIKFENQSNGGLNTTLENQKILRTSTPTADDAVDQICIESPSTSTTTAALMRNDASQFCFDDVEKPLSGILDLNSAPQPAMATTSAILDIHAPADNTIKYQKFGAVNKVNGNLSPYQSLQVSSRER